MEKEVAEFKQFAADDPNMKMKVMITIVRQFGDDLIEAIEGRGTGEIITTKLSGMRAFTTRVAALFAACSTIFKGLVTQLHGLNQHRKSELGNLQSLIFRPYNILLLIFFMAALIQLP